MKIKRGFLAMVLAAIFAFSLFPAMPVYANEPTIAVTVDGQRVAFGNRQPAIIDGRTLVPVRDVFEFLGFEVQFDTNTQQITLNLSANPS